MEQVKMRISLVVWPKVVTQLCYWRSIIQVYSCPMCALVYFSSCVLAHMISLTSSKINSLQSNGIQILTFIFISESSRIYCTLRQTFSFSVFLSTFSDVNFLVNEFTVIDLPYSCPEKKWTSLHAQFNYNWTQFVKKFFFSDE